MYCLESESYGKVKMIGFFNFILNWQIYFVSDFSFHKWMDENKLTQDNLADNDVSKLFSYLGLSYYLNPGSCNGSRSPYYPSQHGWNKSKFFLVYCHFRKIKHSLYMNIT
jgi:hypothetical protein